MVHYILLEKKTDSTLEQIMLFDAFYSHKVESIGKDSASRIRYDAVGMSKEECRESFIKDGFKEIANE